MNDPRAEADRWFRQAGNDLLFARRGLSEGFHAQACFLSQQAAEKAVKAVHYLSGERTVLGHSVRQLLHSLEDRMPEAMALLETGGLLDQFYIPTRYPNGLPDGAPYEVYTAGQAEDAVRGAQAVLDFAAGALSRHPGAGG